jgi:DnaJ-class molecular chaperone
MIGKKKESTGKRYVQCTSMYPTRDGAVFCVAKGGQGHEGDHVGFRKRWRTCTACKGTGAVTPGKRPLRCGECKGIGNVLVKKEKVDGKLGQTASAGGGAEVRREVLGEDAVRGSA